MEKHMGYLQQLKDYDENLAKEQAARAEEEEQKRRIQVGLWLYERPSLNG